MKTLLAFSTGTWSAIAVFGAVNGKPLTVAVAGVVVGLNAWLYRDELAGSGGGGELDPTADLRGDAAGAAVPAARATASRPSTPRALP